MNHPQMTQLRNPEIILPHIALDYRRDSEFSFVNIILFLVGSFLLLISEASPSLLIAASFFFCVGWFTLWIPKLGGKWERFIYTRVFLVGFLSAGISAAYRIFFGDVQGDASVFFELASSGASGLSITQIASISEGSLAVVIWRNLFDLMAIFGFPRDQYIGVLSNVLFVAISAVVAIKIVKLIYGFDILRFKILTLMYATCGLFYVFSGIFIRDSLVLLSVTLLVYVWVYFLKTPDFGIRFTLLLISTVLSTSIFGFLRSEFVFVPSALLIPAIAAISFEQKLEYRKSESYLLLFFGIVLISVCYVIFGEGIQLALSRGSLNYLDQSLTESNASSLGTSLILNQPFPIKVVLGSLYLYIMPIPIWVGFQLDSSYHLFKSLNLIFVIFLSPLFLLALHHLWTNKLSRSSPILFMLFISISFTLVVAATSLESRHLGAFYVPIFIFALLPNMQNSIIRSNYLQVLYSVIVLFIVIHFAWLFLKLSF